MAVPGGRDKPCIVSIFWVYRTLSESALEIKIGKYLGSLQRVKEMNDRHRKMVRQQSLIQFPVVNTETPITGLLTHKNNGLRNIRSGRRIDHILSIILLLLFCISGLSLREQHGG